MALKLAIALAVLAFGGRAAAAPLEAEMVEALLARTKVPSVAVGVVRDGKVVEVRAFGEAAPGRRATAETLYNVASLTKPVSAEVVLRLAAKGRLTLDEPMSPTWLDPDLAADPQAMGLTPRVALSHRTGFPNWRGGGRLAFQQPPGAALTYSGEGYNYLTRFAEQREGRSLTALAESLVFKPAGMRWTTYTAKPWLEGRVATPTDEGGRRLPPQTAQEANAADLLYATAGDYARFLAEVSRGRGLNARLASERLQIATDAQAKWCPKERAGCPDALGFGLGWEVARFGQRTYLMHTGRDPGVFTLAYVSPTNRSGMVILTNSAVGHLVMLPILEAAGAEAEFVNYLKARVG